eukprot:6211930-Pleurochrysis_carterae.AAC.4
MCRYEDSGVSTVASSKQSTPSRGKAATSNETVMRWSAMWVGSVYFKRKEMGGMIATTLPSSRRKSKP